MELVEVQNIMHLLFPSQGPEVNIVLVGWRINRRGGMQMFVLAVC